jgi:hypothetical protein
MLPKIGTKEQIARRAHEAALKNSLREKQRIHSLKNMGYPKNPRRDLVKLAYNGSAQAKFNLIALFGTSAAANMIRNYKEIPDEQESDQFERYQDPDFECEVEY